MFAVHSLSHSREKKLFSNKLIIASFLLNFYCHHIYTDICHLKFEFCAYSAREKNNRTRIAISRAIFKKKIFIALSVLILSYEILFSFLLTLT